MKTCTGKKNSKNFWSSKIRFLKKKMDYEMMMILKTLRHYIIDDGWMIKNVKLSENFVVEVFFAGRYHFKK